MKPWEKPEGWVWERLADTLGILKREGKKGASHEQTYGDLGFRRGCVQLRLAMVGWPPNAGERVWRRCSNSHKKDISKRRHQVLTGALERSLCRRDIAWSGHLGLALPRRMP